MKKKRKVMSIFKMDKDVILLKMKLLTLLMFAAFVSASASSYSQSVKFNLNMKDVSISDVFQKIEEQSEFVILFNEKTLDLKRKVDVTVTSETVDKILDQIFKGDKNAYKIFDHQIAIFRNEIKDLPSGIKFESNVEQPQKKELSGTVKDSRGLPLPGVTVVVKGTTKGTITDNEGRFRISVPVDTKAIIFSFIGMKTQEFPISGKTTFNVVMAEMSVGLDEVVAVGYGTIRKSDLTGSVSKVTVKGVSERSVTSVEQLLQGQVSGVQITSNTGAPGGGMTFNIRGMASISGSNQPLIVIDGYPVESDNSTINMKQGGDGNTMGYFSANNVMANLNPGDIESVEILKDASAAAIYGSRATNGVVLITTKSGKAGKDKIEYNFRSDISKLPKIINVLSTPDYLQYSNEAYLNSKQDSIYKSAAIAQYMQVNTNWQDLIYRTAYSQDHQLNMSGGNEKMKYSLSMGYLGQTGIVKNSGFDRGSLRLNLDREVNEKLKFGMTVNGTVSLSRSVAQSSSIADPSTSVVRAALLEKPIITGYTADDEIDPTQLGNPLTLILLTTDKSKNTTLLANMFMNYTIVKGLDFKIRGGVNSNISRRDLYYPKGTTLGNYNGGYGYFGEGESFNYLGEYTLSYNKTINKKHRLNAVVGYTWQEWTRSAFGIGVQGFANDNLTYYDLSSASTINAPKTITQKWGLSSVISRFNYSFGDRYLFTFTGRADGATRLAEGKKWDFFPSIALGWNLHNEKFMKSVEFITNCKLRASYGLSGNQSIGVGSTKAQLTSAGSVVNQTIIKGYFPANISNPNLHWEITKQTNLGLDMAFLHNRITFGFEYYKKRSNDLLIDLTIPPSNGFKSYSTNMGSIENKGFEFDLRGKLIDKDLKWDIAGNISFNRNIVISLGTASSFVGSLVQAVGSQTLHIAKVGYPIGSYYGYRIEGIYQNQAEVAAGPTDASVTNAPGSFKFKDISGMQGVPDGKIDANDREIIGNPFPDYIFGLTNDFAWKRFSLNILIQGNIGQDVINANRFYLDALCRGLAQSNVSLEAWNNRWTGEGTSYKYPRATTNAAPFANRFTDFIVEDASFIRLKNVTLSYNFPIKKFSLTNNIKLYASAGNLITFTNYKGYDPEINSRGDRAMMPGIDDGSIPQYRTYSLGITMGF